MAKLEDNRDVEVSIETKGTFKFKEETTTPSGTGWVDVTITVPSGKKYIPKWLYASKSSGATMTIDNINTAIVPSDSVGVTIDQTAAATKTLQLEPPIMELVSGDSVKVSFNLSAYTDGDVRVRLLYQEVDT